MKHQMPRTLAHNFALDRAPGHGFGDGRRDGATYHRYGERPADWQTRLVGMGGTTAVILLLLAGALASWQAVKPRLVSPSAPLAVEMLPLAAPPEPVHEVAPGPQQAEQQDAPPVPDAATSTPPPLVRLPAISPSARQPEPARPVTDPGPRVAETTAPKNVAAPAAARMSSEARPNWEAQLLAHLQRHRRFPARARAARQEGTVQIRFRMNRAGAVLSSSVQKSSGFSTLDMAALDTLKRAQPLPAIPADRPDIVELTIPVEFYIGR